MNRLITGLLVVVMTGMFSERLQAQPPAPPFTIRAVGFTDAEHTRNDGYRESELWEGSTNGIFGGNSNRYSGSTLLGQSPWVYNAVTDTIVNVSRTGTEFTRNDGYRFGEVPHATASGLAGFHMWRYNGTSTQLGIVPFVYNLSSGSYTRLGLTGTEHTASDGTQTSVFNSLQESGVVTGHSSRFNGGPSTTSLGVTTWVYNPSNGSTTVVGLTDGDHTRSDGHRGTMERFTTQSGIVLGQSNRYSGMTDIGTTAWRYDVSTATQTVIGLTDAAHTGTNGARHTSIIEWNEGGTVAGWSFRYSGGTQAGRSAWVYVPSAGVNRRIGYFDAAHTSSTGVQSSTSSFVNDNGIVFGASDRYLGSADGGETAWAHDTAANVTRRIGLINGQYVRNDGYQWSRVMDRSPTHAVGFSEQFSGSTHLGWHAWHYNVTTDTSTRIGLTGPDYIRSDGFEVHVPFYVSTNGGVFGQSTRYDATGGLGIGSAAWFYNVATNTTIDISIVDAAHTSSLGERHTELNYFNDRGQAIGYADRHLGSDFNGQSGMVYDSATNSLYALSFSVRNTDGYSFTQPEFISETGTVLGMYELYDNSGVYLGDRLFYWSQEYGFGDLGSLVSGGLDANGWEELYMALGDTFNGYIGGQGIRNDAAGSDMGYVLVSAAVPEASTWALLGASAVAALGATRWWQVRRRRALEAEADAEEEL
jgi:hypothetical protein